MEESVWKSRVDGEGTVGGRMRFPMLKLEDDSRKSMPTNRSGNRKDMIVRFILLLLFLLLLMLLWRMTNETCWKFHLCQLK